MEHSYVHTNGVIEKYLLNQLNEEQESSFEEHLLQCRDCQAEVKIMELILGQLVIRKTEKIFSGRKVIHPEIKRSRFTFPPLIWLRLAASLLVLTGITVFLFLLFKKDTERENSFISRTFTDTASSEYSRPVASDREISDSSKDMQKEDIYAYNENAFRRSEFYEPLVKNVYRSHGLTLSEPEIDLKEGRIKFNWTYPDNESLLLVLINNTDSVIVQVKATSPFHFSKPLRRGIYYWQLQTDQETIYTGKLLLKQDMQ